MFHRLNYGQIARRRWRWRAWAGVIIISTAALSGTAWLSLRYWRSASPASPSAVHNLPLASTVDDSPDVTSASVDFLGAPDFLFVFGESSFLNDYKVLTIKSDGECEYIFSEPWQHQRPDGSFVIDRVWKRAVFKIDNATLNILRQLLVDVDVIRLKKEYHAAAYDGVQRWLRVRASGVQKSIFCDNHFPAPFERIRGFAANVVSGVGKKAIQAALPIEEPSREVLRGIERDVEH